MPLPETFQEIELGMTNFDYSIDKGFEDAIMGKECFGRHAGWDFNGKVYYKDEQFHEDVWQYHLYAETKSAYTLEELMEIVNKEYGYK